MRTILDRYHPVRAPEDGGGGNAAAPAPGGDGGATPPAGDGSGSGEGVQTGGVAVDAPSAAAASGPYRPEGLPDTIFGKDDRETIDKMATALKGYRSKESGVPATVEAYREFKLDDAPEAIRPHLEALAKDPLFDAVAQVAHEEKVPAATLQKITSKLYEQAGEMGILDHVVDVEKERTSLLPEAARSLPKAEQDRQIDARLQGNEDWIKLQVQHGLPEDVANHGLLMLMDTAAGNQMIEFFRNKMTGGDRANPQPGDAGGNGTSQREQLRARLAADEMQPSHPKFSRAAYDQLMADYQKLSGS